MSLVLGGLVAAFASTVHAQVEVTGSSWSNIAWGFEDAGSDVTEDVDIVLLDLDFQSDRIEDLKNAGVTVLCYFSGGSYEDFRDYADAEGNIDQAIVDLWLDLSVAPLDGYPDEQWVDISRLDDLKTVVSQRMDKAKALGCDGVEVDNVDCFQNSPCRLNLQAGRLSENAAKPFQLAFNQFQTEYAHSLGLSIGLKNCLDLVEELAPSYDFAVNEECEEYEECDVLTPFTDNGKLVLHVEYKLKNSICDIDEQIPGFLTKMCKGSDGVCNDDIWTSCFLNFTGVVGASAYTSVSTLVLLIIGVFANL